MTDDWKGSHRGFQARQEKEATAAAAATATGYDHAERLGQDRRYIGQRSNTVATV